jgi:hypothetical protein
MLCSPYPVYLWLQLHAISACLDACSMLMFLSLFYIAAPPGFTYPGGYTQSYLYHTQTQVNFTEKVAESILFAVPGQWIHVS